MNYSIAYYLICGCSKARNLQYQVNWKKMPTSAGKNYLALTGSLPDLDTWSAALPNELYSSVNQWRTCNYGS